MASTRIWPSEYPINSNVLPLTFCPSHADKMLFSFPFSAQVSFLADLQVGSQTFSLIVDSASRSPRFTRQPALPLTPFLFPQLVAPTLGSVLTKSTNPELIRLRVSLASSVVQAGCVGPDQSSIFQQPAKACQFPTVLVRHPLCISSYEMPLSSPNFFLKTGAFTGTLCKLRVSSL